jgi:hypothetical protein
MTQPSIAENNAATTKRGKESRTSPISVDYSNKHCGGVKWSAIYKIGAGEGKIKIWYAHHSGTGTLEIPVPLSKSVTDDMSLQEKHELFLIEREKHINAMIDMMHQHDHSTEKR